LPRPPRSSRFPYTTRFRSIRLSLASVALGLLLGLLGASAKVSGNRALRGVGGFYTSVVRGVPETLWVLMAYYGTTSYHRGIEARSEEHTSELQSRENLVCR